MVFDTSLLNTQQYKVRIKSVRGVIVIVVENEMKTVTRVQTLDEVDCISHCTNILGKGMNPIILPPAMGK